MTPDDYARHDGLGLAALIAEGAVTAAEVVAAAIARVEARDPALNAVVLPAFEAALAEATDIGAGPFAGVPFVVKDLGCAQAGRRHTLGSRYLEHNVAEVDAELYRRYRRAGLIALGRTNTPEWGLNVATEPALFGPTRNPWNSDYSPGGSSGGTAAAVAARMVPLGHASDGGGSIRIPASCCGLFGLKPTRMRTPHGPVASEGWSGFASAHVLTRSVRDSAAALDATAGPDIGDPYAAPAVSGSYLAALDAPPGRLRIALVREPFDDLAVAADCLAAVEDAARLCAELGHVVVEARPAFDVAAFNQAKLAVIAANAAADIAEIGDLVSRPPAVDELEPATRLIVEAGAEVGASEMALAIRLIQRVSRVVGRFMVDHDLILTPTLARIPARIGALRTDVDSLDAFARSTRPYIAFTSLFNATGQPAMSVPLYWNAAGLPIGVQFAARFGDETTLFRLAAQLEQARPWAGRRPPDQDA